MIVINRKERDKQLRRADILKAAEHVFASKGYYEATIQDIAQKAQYGTGTVYLYFKDKNALYFSLLEEKIRSLTDAIRGRVEEAKGSRKKLEVFIQESLDYFEKNQDFFKLYILEKNSVQLIMSKRIASSAVEYGTEYMEKIISLAQEERVVREDCKPSELTDILVSILGSFVLNWINKESKRAGTLKDKAGLIFNIFLNGVAKK
ncbi:MAG: TetR/AcrR family transcriptional regulator [Candidatus Omnitrophica bacterium]|nr:TetR/AcrR family transcriptional regulator [Candidatus Omnitrophota bacterium]